MTFAEPRKARHEKRDLARRALRPLTRWLVPRYRPSRARTGKVAIVVPLSLRPTLLPEEEISLRHLCHFLGRYDRYLVAPAGSSIHRDGFVTIQFPRKFFGSPAAHARLGYWPDFYRAFEAYEYILIYHLDALVFSDELLQWCDAGWDYIGAPWLPCPDSPWVVEPAVGNGGFTLMKVQSCLEVLHNRYRDDPVRYVSDLITFNGHRLGVFFRLLDSMKGIFPHSKLISWPLDRWEQSENPVPHSLNNDLFWAFQAVRYLPRYKVASVEAALRFAFEACPRMCFEMNKRQLPFGCHAWTKYDRAFWEPFLVGGDEAPASQPQVAK